ncbi:hypothetical protein [Chryseobacterium indoltheticum]|uniref:hypothetical protein n=1 Tax=Chryseobacterium indoltheticum TaxID=254 RepID=UPI003F4929A4
MVLGSDGGIFPMYLNMIKSDPQIANKPNPGGYPWNHVEDMAGIFAFAVENNLDGVYNSVSPQPASMQDVFKATANEIANTNYKLSTFQGQHLVSHKIISKGYVFKYPNIEKAIHNIVASLKS